MEVGLVLVALLVIVIAAAVIAAVHLAGIGRVTRKSPIGIRSHATLASAEAWRTAHRAATPVTWLTGAIALIAAFAALGFASAEDGATEATVLIVFGVIVLIVGITLAVWRGIASVR